MRGFANPRYSGKYSLIFVVAVQRALGPFSLFALIIIPHLASNAIEEVTTEANDTKHRRSMRNIGGLYIPRSACHGSVIENLVVT